MSVLKYLILISLVNFSFSTVSSAELPEDQKPEYAINIFMDSSLSRFMSKKSEQKDQQALEIKEKLGELVKEAVSPNLDALKLVSWVRVGRDEILISNVQFFNDQVASLLEENIFDLVEFYYQDLSTGNPVTWEEYAARSTKNTIDVYQSEESYENGEAPLYSVNKNEVADIAKDFRSRSANFIKVIYPAIADAIQYKYKTDLEKLGMKLD